MATHAPQPSPIPAHIPADRVEDFDAYHPILETENINRLWSAK